MDKKVIKIGFLLELIDNSESLESLKDKILEMTGEKPIKIMEMASPKVELSDFNKKLKQGLNWNPKKK